MPMDLVFSVLAAYVLGSIPFGLVCVRLLRGVDVREHGSGNIGATNVFRVGGWLAGVLTLALDALKGAAPVWAVLQAWPDSLWLGPLVGFAALAGHSWSLFLRFGGGKGVATALGVFAVLLPWPLLMAVGGFALGFGLTGAVSAGSMLAALVLPMGAVVLGGIQHPTTWLALLAAVLVLIKHRANAVRLVRGEENRLFRGALQRLRGN